MLRQALAPGMHCVFRNAERDMSRASPVLFRQGTWRQDITTRCLVGRVRSCPAEDQQIALVGHAKHAAYIGLLSLCSSRGPARKNRRRGAGPPRKMRFLRDLSALA